MADKEILRFEVSRGRILPEWVRVNKPTFRIGDSRDGDW